MNIIVVQLVLQAQHAVGVSLKTRKLFSPPIDVIIKLRAGY